MIAFAMVMLDERESAEFSDTTGCPSGAMS